MREGPIHQSHVYGRIKISRTFFEKGHPRNIPVKLFQNLTSSFGEDFLRISSCPYSARSPHSPGPYLWTDQNFGNTFWKGSPKEHSCEIISKADQQFLRRRFFNNCLKIQFRCHGNQSFRWNQILWPVFEGDLLKNIPAKFGPNWPAVWEEKMFREIVDDARRTHHHPKSSPWARCSQVS